MNCGNGSAGSVIRAITQRLPINVELVHLEPNGNFPNGVPNPLLPPNRLSTIEVIQEVEADIGVAWDGDFDRCFFFDNEGTFIEGYYVVGLLAESMLRKYPGSKIIHDPRLTWNTIDIVNRSGGTAVQSKTGHAFIKERMRLEDAVYGGEMSAHHYFKQFAYCDSGMIPWLMVLELMSTSKLTLKELVYSRMQLYPCSGEVNFKVDNIDETINRVVEHFSGDVLHIDYTDGVSLEFSSYRLNIRASNTEPLLRVNIESRGDQHLVEQKLKEIELMINR